MTPKSVTHLLLQTRQALPVAGTLGVVLLALIAGCSRESSGETGSQLPVVRVTTPIQRDVTDYVYFTGRLEAVNAVEVQARVTGYLTEIKFKEGSYVKTGDHLYTIDPRPYQATLDRANGQVGLAEARLKLAKADFARAETVAKTPGAISSQEVDKFAAAQDEAAAALEAAIADRESAELNLEFTEIKSPIDGLIGRYLMTLGNLVHQDNSTLTTIVSQDPIYGYFDVDERTLLRVARMIVDGKVKPLDDGVSIPVELGLADEGNLYPHIGKMNFVNNAVNSSTGTMEIRGVFDNPLLKEGGPRRFTAGQFVRVRVPLGEPHGALIVPQAAIGTDQSVKYLYVVDANDTVEYRPVTLDAEQPDGMQVVLPVQIVRTKDGVREAEEGEQGEPSVKPGDRIVIGGLQRVHPGQKVQVKAE